jgi:MOSC domain-containing protein YiiM
MDVMPRVTHIWVSPAKRQPMEERSSANAVAGHGLEGCAHARPGTKREVLFVSADHLDALDVSPGATKENFTVAGADVQDWPIGQRVRIGDAVFEIAMVCDPCEQMEKIRPGLQAELEGRRGMLARVIEGGRVAAGDEIALLD